MPTIIFQPDNNPWLSLTVSEDNMGYILEHSIITFPWLAFRNNTIRNNWIEVLDHSWSLLPQDFIFDSFRVRHMHIDDYIKPTLLR